MAKVQRALSCILTLLILTVCMGGQAWADLSIDWSKQHARMNAATVGAATAGAPAAGHCDDATHDGAGNAIALCEDFDGSTLCATGFSSTCQLTWTASQRVGDTLDFDNTTSPAPTQGTYSARITTADSSATQTYFQKTLAGETDNFYVFARVTAITAGDAAIYFMALSGAAGDTCALSRNNSTSVVGLWNGSSTTGSAVEMTEDTDYCVWLEVERNTATTGCRAYIAAYSSGCTKPGSASVKMTSLDRTTGIIKFDAKESSEFLFDYIRVRTSSAFGNNPD